MRARAHRIIALCASPAGMFVLAALDSTLFVWLPLGIDAAVHHPRRAARRAATPRKEAVQTRRACALKHDTARSRDASSGRFPTAETA